MAYEESNGYVIDYVMWPWTVRQYGRLS